MIGVAHEFRGTARFEVLSLLGQGGMGSVYAAFDREHGLRVALKTLSASLPVMNAERLRLFKKEFRALQDLQHPNLVQLGELFEEDGHWFFTMELIEGVDFMSFVRNTASEPAEPATSDLDAPALETEPTTTALPRPVAALHAGCDEARLRSTLAQLARGLGALHAEGKVHRDIKPSKVTTERDRTSNDPQRFEVFAN